MEQSSTSHQVKYTLLTYEYPPDKGGIAAYLGGLVEALNVPVEVIRDARALQAAGPWSWRATIRTAWRARHSTALIVSHILPLGTAAWITHTLGGAPYALFVHGTDIDRANRSWRKRILAKHIAKKAFIVFANSQHTAQLAREVLGVEAHVMTPGVASVTPAPRDKARKTLNIDVSQHVVVSVGRLVERKGFDVLMAALNELDERTHVYILGDGPDRARLEALARTHQRVHVLGAVSHEERRLYYSAADVFALPSRSEPGDIEGFGVVFLEAAAYGLPIVAGNSGGVAEAVEDGVTGTLVDPHNSHKIAQAIIAYQRDPELAKTHGEAGEKRVEHEFRWQQRAQQFQDAFPLVSIIIPAYNRPHALRKTLQSIVRQTYTNIEIIIIDDASTEPIRAVLDEFSQLPWSYERLARNSGAPVARNTGFARSRGSLVVFLDADAVLAPDMLERSVKTLREYPEADFVYGDHRFGWKLFRGRDFDAQALREGNYLHTSALMRRNAFVEFDESLRRFQDWDLFLRMTDRGSTGVYVPQVLFRLQRGGTMSSWIPSFVHRMPWERIGWMPKRLKAFREAREIIVKKHQL